MTMTIPSIRVVLILATFIGIRGQETTPREAALSLTSNFDDGLSDRAFKVDFVGVTSGSSATINIYKEGEASPKVVHEISTDADRAKSFYFQMKENEAPEGSYQVEVCAGKCSAKREAFGKIMKEERKPTLSCIKGRGKEENIFYRFEKEEGTEVFNITIQSGSSFPAPVELNKAVGDSSAFKKYSIKSNPAYETIAGQKVFYAAVFYDGTHLKDLLDTAVDKKTKEILDKKYKVNRKLAEDLHTHAYCSRKYFFWASVQIMSEGKKVVLRRYRGTVLPTEFIVNKYILKENAPPIPVEFVRKDVESKKLTPGNYDVSVSFCATDKDEIDSSICSKPLFTTMRVD